MTQDELARDKSVTFVGWTRFNQSSQIPLFKLNWVEHPLHNTLIDANTVLRLDIDLPSVEICRYKQELAF